MVYHVQYLSHPPTSTEKSFYWSIQKTLMRKKGYGNAIAMLFALPAKAITKKTNDFPAISFPK